MSPTLVFFILSTAAALFIVATAKYDQLKSWLDSWITWVDHMLFDAGLVTDVQNQPLPQLPEWVTTAQAFLIPVMIVLFIAGCVAELL